MAPITGVAHISYVPAERVVGVSKLARVVDCIARRLQIQERMTAEIAAIIEIFQPREITVVIEATHACMSTRGVGVMTITSRMLGDGCYRLRMGLLRIIIESPEGDELVIAFLGPGAMVGDLPSSTACRDLPPRSR